MIGLLVVGNMPRDLTAPKAYAKSILWAARHAAVSHGFDDLRRTLLPKGDIEARLWGGFAFAGNTTGTIFRRRAGYWSASRVESSLDFGPVILPAPKLGWPVFWKEAGQRGLWTLKDDREFKNRKGYVVITDGNSTLVEVQREGKYRAYGYCNPAFNDHWPPAKPMVELERFVWEQFPTP